MGSRRRPSSDFSVGARTVWCGVNTTWSGSKAARILAARMHEACRQAGRQAAYSRVRNDAPHRHCRGHFESCVPIWRRSKRKRKNPRLKPDANYDLWSSKSVTRRPERLEVSWTDGADDRGWLVKGPPKPRSIRSCLLLDLDSRRSDWRCRRCGPVPPAGLDVGSVWSPSRRRSPNSQVDES